MLRSRVSLDVPRPTTRSRVVKPKPPGDDLLKKKPLRPKVAKVKSVIIDRKAPVKRRRRGPVQKVDPLPIIASAVEQPSSLPVLRNNVQVALLSPFRFPLDSARLVAQMARLSGVAFVVIGALLALFNLDIAAEGRLYESVARQSAATLETISTTSSTTATPGTSLQTSDPTPAVTMTLSSETELRGRVPVYLSVPYAETVIIVVFDTTEGKARWSGTAERLDDRNWKAWWDTTQVIDGTYTVHAKIKNVYGQYEYVHTLQYVVKNFESVNSGTVTATNTNSDDSHSSTIGSTSTVPIDYNSSNTTATSTNSVSTTTSPKTTANLSLKTAQPVSTIARFEIVAYDVDHVKLTARNKSNGTTVDIGSALFRGDGEWRFDWNVESMTVGTYTVRAHLRSVSGALFTSNLVEVSVARALTESVATTTVIAPSPSTLDSTVPTVPKAALEPPISISFPYEGVASGVADITVSVQKARFVELYVRPANALTPRFIGLARHLGEGEWHLSWDTTKTPNGDYEMFARVAHEYGTTDGGRFKITVRNQYSTTLTAEQEKQISALKETYRAIEPAVVATISPDVIPVVSTVMPLSEKFTELRLDEVDLQERLTELFETYRLDLNQITTVYAEAIRKNDVSAKQAAEVKIADLRTSIMNRLDLPTERAYAETDLDAYIRELTKAAIERIERNEALIKERLAERVLIDSDRDGISDFDEINLYGTNPYKADTDDDGITDNLEIIGGFDPLSSETESLVIYESPKETGITRDDLLQINMISTLKSVTDNQVETKYPSAVISGTGLPHAFVTLYIFSTPIIVTVRADENGNWTYIFDKELEDGEHVAFVAMTDNRGTIVAKSNPFAFTKTAEAFTPVDAGATPLVVTTPVEPSFWTSQLLIVIASLSVVALGLVLLLLGLHVETRRVAPQAV